MKRGLCQPLCVVLLVVAAPTIAAELPGPTPATERISAHGDARNEDAKLENLRDAIPWIVRNGDESALPIIEECLADSLVRAVISAVGPGLTQQVLRKQDA